MTMNTIIKKVYHKWMKRKMLHHYRKQFSELEIVEAIVTEDIIAGNHNRREELNQTQQNIKATEKFLSALIKLK